MPDTTQISVRIPSEQAQALEKIANEEDRTVTAEVRRLIRNYVIERAQVAAA
jgi:predicted DNA-binding protein